MTPEQAIGQLCVAVGILIARGIEESHIKCLIESILVLAKSAGVSREKAIQPFDLYARYAEEIWDEEII